MKSIEIKYPQDISNVLSILHDSKVDIGKIRFEGRRLSIEAKRPDTFSRKLAVKNYVVFKKLWVPLVLCKLEFDNVGKYEVVDDQGIAIYTIDTYTFKWPDLTIEFSEVTKLKITLGDINGRFIDIRELEEYDKSWIVPPWWQLGSSRNEEKESGT